MSPWPCLPLLRSRLHTTHQTDSITMATFRRCSLWFFFYLACIGGSASTSTSRDHSSRSALSSAATDESSQSCASASFVPSPYARVRPDEALKLPVFTNFISNSTISSAHGHNGPAQLVKEAAVVWPSPVNVTSYFAVYPSLVSRAEVSSILGAIRDSGVDFNSEFDTVDQMPVYNFYVSRGDIDGDVTRSENPPQHHALQKELRRLFLPIEERITALVRRRYPEQCGAGQPAERQCHPCYSLVRQYLPDKRRGLDMHRGMCWRLYKRSYLLCNHRIINRSIM